MFSSAAEEPYRQVARPELAFQREEPRVSKNRIPLVDLRAQFRSIESEMRVMLELGEETPTRLESVWKLTGG